MNKLYSHVLILMAFAFSFGTSAQTPMYIAGVGSTSLIQIDTTTFAEIGTGVTMTSSLGSIDNILGMATRPCSGELYVVYQLTSNSSNRRLGIVDPVSGVITDVGPMGDKVAGICFGDQDHLYAVTGDGATVPETLYKVNLASAAMTFFVAYGNGDDGESIAFNTVDGRIYHWSGLGTPVMESTDTLTGATINIPLSGYNNGEIRASTFIGNNTFLVSDASFYMEVNTTGFFTQGAAVTSGVPRGMAFPLQTPVISTLDPTSFCPGDSAVFNVTTSGTYQWLLDGVPIPGATNSSYTVTQAGDLSAQVTGGGCVVPSNAIAIIHFTVPVVTLTPSGSVSICPGSDVVLTGTTGGTLQWYMNGAVIPGATSSTYTATAAGVYNQLKINSNGCSDSSAVGVTVSLSTIPVVVLNPAMDTTFCTGDSLLLTGTTGGTLQWYRNGVAISGATSSTYFVTTSGLYNQLKTNASGCSDSSAVGVTVVEIADCDVSLFDDPFNHSLKLYPSPSENSLNISIDVLNDGELKLELYSLEGKRVQSSVHATISGTNTITIPTAELSAGVYVISIQQNDSIVTQRFVKK